MVSGGARHILPVVQHNDRDEWAGKVAPKERPHKRRRLAIGPLRAIIEHVLSAENLLA